MQDQTGCDGSDPRTPLPLFINRLGRLAMEHEFEGKPQGLSPIYASSERST